jgi:hypothetical protein
VNEVESQAALNTLTEHGFQDHLKIAEALGTMNTRGKRLLRGWLWPVDPKLGFDQLAARSRKLWIPPRMFIGIGPRKLNSQSSDKELGEESIGSR